MLKRLRRDIKNTHNCTKKILMNQIIMTVWSVTQSQTFWTLGSTAVNKATRCNGIPIELFKTLDDDAIKVLH